MPIMLLILPRTTNQVIRQPLENIPSFDPSTKGSSFWLRTKWRMKRGTQPKTSNPSIIESACAAGMSLR